VCAQDIEYVLDHAQKLQRISLIEPSKSSHPFGVRLLTQSKYEKVEFTCSAKSWTAEMGAYLLNNNMVTLQFKLKLISHGVNDRYLFAMIQAGVFIHLNELELKQICFGQLKQICFGQDFFEMIATHCPLLERLVLSRRIDESNRHNNLCVSEFPQGWRRLRSVIMLGSIVDAGSGGVSCTTTSFVETYKIVAQALSFSSEKKSYGDYSWAFYSFDGLECHLQCRLVYLSTIGF